LRHPPRIQGTGRTLTHPGVLPEILRTLTRLGIRHIVTNPPIPERQHSRKHHATQEIRRTRKHPSRRKHRDQLKIPGTRQCRHIPQRTHRSTDRKMTRRKVPSSAARQPRPLQAELRKVRAPAITAATKAAATTKTAATRKRLSKILNP